MEDEAVLGKPTATPLDPQEPPEGGTQPAAASPPKARRLDRIARRAHEIYVARGGAAGQDLDDWLQAEREIDAED